MHLNRPKVDERTVIIQVLNFLHVEELFNHIRDVESIGDVKNSESEGRIFVASGLEYL